MGAHGLFCTNMWELRSSKMTLPKTVEALRLSGWLAGYPNKHLLSLHEKFKLTTEAPCLLGSLKKDPVENHGALRLRWSAYMVYKQKPVQLT